MKTAGPIVVSLTSRSGFAHLQLGRVTTLGSMFSGLESPMHLMVVLVIAALLFGPKRLPELGRSLGQGVHAFRQSLSGENEEHPD
jgi:sec-independent protein translocase protein TatA